MVLYIYLQLKNSRQVLAAIESKAACLFHSIFSLSLQGWLVKFKIRLVIYLAKRGTFPFLKLTSNIPVKFNYTIKVLNFKRFSLSVLR